MKKKLNTNYLELGVLSVWSFVMFVLAFQANGCLLGIDDAHIFFTYAANLAEGRGLIYSQGIPPVEGYTSSFWMILSAFNFLLHFNLIGVLAVSFIIFLITHLIGFRILENLISKENVLIAKFFYVALISASFGYISWSSVTLMDTGLWCLIIMAMSNYVFNTSCSRRLIKVSLTFIIAALSRPESILVVPSMAFAMFISREQNKLTVRNIVIPLFFFGITLACLTSLRLTYFGYIFPNTYYAKVSSDVFSNIKSGLIYLTDYWTSNLLVMCIGLGVLVSAVQTIKSCIPIFSGANSGRINNQPQNQRNVVGFLITSLTIPPIITGGDHFNMFRLFQPTYPLYIIFFLTILFSKLRIESIRTSIAFGIVFIILTAVIPFKNSWGSVLASKSPIAHEFELAEYGMLTGIHLNHLFRDLRRMPRIGVIIAGGIARTYNGTSYDLMGLNNEFVAHFSQDRTGLKNHAAFNSKAFFKLPIDMLMTMPDMNWANSILKDLFNENRFVEDFIYGTFRNNENSLEYTGFFRRDFVQESLRFTEHSFIELPKFSWKLNLPSPVDHLVWSRKAANLACE